MPISLPDGISLKKSRHLPAGLGDVSFGVKARPGSDVLSALASDSPFPPRRIDLLELSVGVEGERPLTLNGGKGGVTFGGKASGYQGVAVLDDPAEVTALLVRDRVNDDLASGLAIDREPGCRFVLLRCGYDLEAAAKGSVALGLGASASFGAEAKRMGAFAVVRQLPADLGARSAVQATVESWMLPSQFRALDDLEPGTWIVSEVDGSFAMTLGAQYGYDFNWVRDAVRLGGLSGDIGLKVQVGASAAFGFEASGQYAIALGRPRDSQRVRLQLFRLNRKGLSLAFSASASAQGNPGGLLPDHFDDFVQGVFGLHGLQVLKELETWGASDAPLSALLAGVSVGYAEELLGAITGIDAKSQFDAARGRLVSLLDAWNALPHRVASTVYSLVSKQASGVPELKAQLTTLASADLVGFRKNAEALLSHVDFFRTPFGNWLESAALGPVLSAVTDTSEYARVRQVAKQTLAVLDGSLLERTLLNLQRELSRRLALDNVERIVDAASFATADEWLKARLGEFLGVDADPERVASVRAAIHRLLTLRETFFARARTALTSKYEVQLIGTYQKSTTSTALVDVVFDFGAAGASSNQLLRLAAAAIDGDLEQILVQEITGVELKQGVLTHGITRQTHLELTMPFFKTEMDHINSSLAKVEAVQSDRGRILIYDLHADDLVTARGKFASRFAVQGRFAQNTRVRVFDEQSMTHAYSFRQAVPKMRRRALEAQLSSYVESYLPDTFGSGESSLSTWIADLDRTIDRDLKNGPENFGNTVMLLEVTAPSALVGAWALAPDSETAEPYRAMSKAIQAQLRKLIPLCHFQNIEAYKDRIPSAALLVYASMPPATGLAVDRGRIVRFDAGHDVYWDIESPSHVEALANHALTHAALHTRLAGIHELLMQADGMDGVARDYRPDRLAQVLGAALTNPVGIEDLRNLLIVERMVVRDARQAGLKIASFLKASDSEQARTALAEYGSKVTEAFNSTIGGLFSARELRPLGTMVFLEAARAFAPDLQAARPSALLEVTVLTEQPSFDMARFVEGEPVPPGDVVRSERLVSLG